MRLCWAQTMLPHIRKGTACRLMNINFLLNAASRMAKNDADVEVRRILGIAQLTELPEGEADLVFGPDSDLDESDTGET